MKCGNYNKIFIPPPLTKPLITFPHENSIFFTHLHLLKDKYQEQFYKILFINTNHYVQAVIMGGGVKQRGDTGNNFIISNQNLFLRACAADRYGTVRYRSGQQLLITGTVLRRKAARQSKINTVF